MPIKPSHQEETFFAQQELERKRTSVKQKDALTQTPRKDEQNGDPLMRCPKCGSHLAEIGYRDQRVDFCGACGGIWLDAGELEALAMKEGGFLWGLRKVFSG
jgi:uncharacterized protein